MARRDALLSLYRAAIVAVQPERGVHEALTAAPPDRGRPLHIIAIGKASHTMLAAAIAWCAEHDVPVVGGVCVGHDAVPAARLITVHQARGDHPLPAARSAAASTLLESYCASQIAAGSQVIVLLSGGASSLIGAPLPPITGDAFRECCAFLLRAGLDIHAHNLVRRLLTRWGNGRLAAAVQTAGAAVRVLAVSDVPGDALASIGSAPCLFTPVDPAAVDAALAGATLRDPERALLRDAIRQTREVQRAIADVPHQIISSNAIACRAVADAAHARGLVVERSPAMLTDDAHRCGVMVARTALQAPTTPMLYCWGAEPVVALPADAPPGGRMQALALSAARTLHNASAPDHRVTILAAGTDGRDGNTDAAGALIDRATWSAITAMGLDPAARLAAFDSHTALRAVNALLPAFSSGTNVNDLVLALVEPRTAD